MPPQVRVLDPSPTSGPTVVTLDLVDGSLTASGPRPSLPHVLAVPAKGPISARKLQTLASVAQQILDGSGPDAQLTLSADEAFDALVREITQ